MLGYSLEAPDSIFSLRNKKNVNFWTSKSWLDRWILTIVHGQVIKFDNFTTLLSSGNILKNCGKIKGMLALEAQNILIFHTPDKKVPFPLFGMAKTIFTAKPTVWKANKILTLVLLNPDIPCLCKQCSSRSVGF